jgi:hypothetical protein
MSRKITPAENDDEESVEDMHEKGSDILEYIADNESQEIREDEESEELKVEKTEKY